jgi:Tfp pilus assembly protein FimT
MYLKFITNNNMPFGNRHYNRFVGYFVIETLVIITVIMIAISSCWFNGIFANNVNKQNFLKLKTLQQALYFARSEAIRSKQPVYVCPSYDKKDCCYNWAAPIITYTITEKKLILLNHLNLMFISQEMLRFHFFGNQQEPKLTFLPNGTTLNNGHICTNYGLHCLYINQTGKSYIVTKKSFNNN